MKELFDAEPEVLDFKGQPAAATDKINQWVAGKTHDRIRDLIPQPLASSTRLVLADALYLKAPWADEFSANLTKPAPFHVRGGDPVAVPTMERRDQLGYAKREGYSAVTLRYIGGDLQFVILLPDRVDGLPDLEQALTSELLAACTKLETADIRLHLPSFRLEPPTIPLAAELQSLGMKQAFDIPPGSANFDRIAPRQTNEYLAISDVFHKTFIAVDEHGTEAAAATAVTMRATSAFMSPPPPPIEVRVDHPFIHAVQHVSSGACLFLGRVVDPRGNDR